MLNTVTGASKTSSPALTAANQGAVSGVNAINLGGLSPGEANAVERSTNQQNLATGNLGNSNATNTISNAMDFGGAFNNKIPLLNASTNAASTAANAGTGNLAATSALFSPIATNATSPISSSNSLFSSAGSSLGTGSSSNSGIQGGCFLTTAACEYMHLPDDCEELQVLRKFRDEYVPEDLVREYYKIAPKIAKRVKTNEPLLDYIWLTVQDCVKYIKLHRHKQALNRYKLMVRTLKLIYYGCL